MTDKQIQEAAEKWYPVEYAGTWYIQLGEMYNDRNVLDADCVGYEQAKKNAELICEQHNQLSTSNVIEYLEQILNPKYQNDVFTWKQFIDALEGAKWMQSQSQWIPVDKRLPSYGELIVLQYPPEQKILPYVVVFDRDTPLFDGSEWFPVPPKADQPATCS